jgi:DMSO/TMAO reductase YedYZ molybdopterin-dependent catalytic subunit
MTDSDPAARQGRAWLGAGIGLAIAAPLLSLYWLGQQLLNLPMPAYALFELLIRALPGGIVTAGLEAMIGLLTRLGLPSTSAAGKLVETWMALGLVAGLLTLLGAAYAAGVDQRRLPLMVGLGASAALLAWWDDWGQAGWLLGLLWSAGLPALWVLVLDRLLRHERVVEGGGQGRRGFVLGVALGSIGTSLAALGLGRLVERADDVSTAATIFPPRATPTPPPLAGFNPVVGTRPELTPLLDFYRVDINLRPPNAEAVAAEAREQARQLAEAEAIELPPSDLLLSIDGLVEEPRVVSLEDIRQLPEVGQFATLECISNPVGGDLIDTTWFGGARLADVLALARPAAEAVDVQFTCADGYSESLPIDSALDERTLLCYAMAGEPLTEEHGFPFRLYTPDRFGMKNPKWIVRLTLVAEDYLGYWETRGWDEQAWVEITAVIDAVREMGEGRLDVGGIAFAGARGTAGVEVRVDAGPWQPADLARPVSSLTWVPWRIELHAEPGERLLEVRAIDRQGGLQTAVPSEPYPDGATGYHSRSVRFPGQA